ncbi:MAG: twin-arginine translocase TatA/TatE family subunit [Terracidiphilus sp.]
MFDLSLPKLLILAVIALVIFGPNELPTIAAQAGRALRDLRTIAEGAKNDLREELGPELVDFEIERHPMPGQGPWPDRHTKPAGIPNRRAVRPISAATDRRSLSSSASSTRRSGLAVLGQRRLPLAGWLASSPRSTAGRRSGRGLRASC